MPAYRIAREGVAFIATTGAAAATAAGLVALARGTTRGAPGVSKALSRLGKPLGGGMLTGVAVAAGTGAVAGLAAHRIISAARPL